MLFLLKSERKKKKITQKIEFSAKYYRKLAPCPILAYHNLDSRDHMPTFHVMLGAMWSGVFLGMWGHVGCHCRLGC